MEWDEAILKDKQLTNGSQASSTSSASSSNGNKRTGKQATLSSNGNDDKKQQARKLCYMVIMITTQQNYEYLLEDVQHGDAEAAYEAICEEFRSTTISGYVEAQRDFMSSSMAIDNANVSEFIKLVSRRAKEFERLGGHVTEEAKIAVLLQGLLPEFEVKKISFYDRDFSSLTWKQVETELKSFAKYTKISDLKQGGNKSNTFLASTSNEQEECRLWNKYGRCKFDTKCKSKHVGKGGKSNNTNRSKLKTKWCDYCSREGHETNKCFKKRNDERETKPKEKDKMDKDKIMAMIVEGVKTVLTNPEEYSLINIKENSYYAEGDSSEVVADSATSRHTTNDETDFVPGSVVTVDIPVKIGDGVTKCTKMGKVRMRDRKTGNKFIFNDVLLLERCAKKLISESKLDRAGYGQNKPGNGTLIVKPTGCDKTVLQADLNPSGLYVYRDLEVIKEPPKTSNEPSLMNLVAATKDNFKSKKEQSPEVQKAMDNVKQCRLMQRMQTTTEEAARQLELHRIHMHASLPVLRKMYNMADIGDLKCDECLIAKAKWSSVPTTATMPRADAPVKRLHSDICYGRGTRVCWQLIVDDCTRRHFVVKLNGKDEALQTFKEVVLKLENDRAPLKLAYHRTDDEKVYNTEAWKQYRKQNGIEHEPNGPYRKESVIERAARTVGEGA